MSPYSIHDLPERDSEAFHASMEKRSWTSDSSWKGSESCWGSCGSWKRARRSRQFFQPPFNKGHPAEILKQEKCWRNEIVAPATQRSTCQMKNGLEEPEAYEELPGAEEFEDDGKRFKAELPHRRKPSSTSFPNYWLLSRLTSRKSTKEKTSFARNIRILEETLKASISRRQERAENRSFCYQIWSQASCWCGSIASPI